LGQRLKILDMHMMAIQADASARAEDTRTCLPR
jgi:hypothetical protein